MNAKTCLGCLAALLVSVSAFAADPLGPPMASNGCGKMGLALEYSFSDLQLVEEGRRDTYRVDIENMQIAYLTLSMGVTEWLDVFARVGGLTMDGAKTENSRRETEDYTFDYDYDLIYGGGLRVTFAKFGNVTLGAVGAFSYAEIDGDYLKVERRNHYEYRRPGRYQDGTIDAEVQQISVGLGATWQLSESLALYGGGLFHHVRISQDSEKNRREYDSYVQQYDRHYSGSSSDLYKNDDMESMFGGYAGLKWALTEAIDLSVEGSYTADSVGGSASIGMKF